MITSRAAFAQQLQHHIRGLEEGSGFGLWQCHEAQLSSSSLRGTEALPRCAAARWGRSLGAGLPLGPSVLAVATAERREQGNVSGPLHLPRSLHPCYTHRHHH